MREQLHQGRAQRGDRARHLLHYPPHGPGAGLSVTVLGLLGLLGACSEGHLTPKPTEESGQPETGADPPILPEPTIPQPPVDPCDGLDNDGDGVVDEGAPDADGDGVADCVDEDCSAGSFSASAQPGGPNGSLGTADGPASAVLRWSLPSTFAAGCEHLVVGDLVPGPPAEVVCSSASGVFVFEGDTGRPLSDIPELEPSTPLVLADLDRDGVPEVLGFERLGHLLATNLEQGPRWRSNDELLAWNDVTVSPLAVLDLEGDGIPEVATPRGVVSGADGALLTTLDEDDESVAVLFRELTVADLDLDGTVDFVWPWWSLAPDGTPQWRATPSEDWWGPVTQVPVQADEDDDGEILFIGRKEAILIDGDGAELARRRLAGEGAPGDLLGPACVGDIDGDGGPEVVVSTQTAVLALTAWGSELWRIAASDPSSSTQCSTFDFDLDGRDEVLVLDEARFAVLDGLTGAPLFEDTRFPSRTVNDAVIVVDLDGDGSVEVLVSGRPVSDGGAGSPLRAYTHPEGAWPPGSSWWPTETWTGLELNDDGSVPRTPGRPWLSYGHWRSQPEGGISGYDLSAEVVASCASRCEGGVVHLAARIINRGPREAEAGLPLAVYHLDAEGNPTLASVEHLPDWLDDGTASPTLELSLDTEQARLGLRLVAGDDGSALDPLERWPDDNTLDWRWEGCP